MVVAIPVFGSRVSPRLDHAQELLLVRVGQAGRGGAERERIPVGHWNPPERVGRLAALGVNVMICGGIDGRLARQLASRGIEVYSWVTGEAEDTLRCLLAGQLESGQMTGPRGPCGRWRFGGRSRGRCGGWSRRTEG